MNTDAITLTRRRNPNWITVIVLVLFHAGAVAALFMFSWRALAVAAFLYWMTIGLGISMGYHRLHTHRSYQRPACAGIFLRGLRRADAGRRPDFLGGHAPDSPSEVGPAGRSALAARGRLVGAHGLDSVRRDQAQQHPPDGEVRAGSGQGPLLRLALNNCHWVPTVVLAAVAARDRRPADDAVGRSACASSSVCTPHGW